MIVNSMDLLLLLLMIEYLSIHSRVVQDMYLVKVYFSISVG